MLHTLQQGALPRCSGPMCNSEQGGTGPRDPWPDSYNEDTVEKS